jgi:hypothetical protein
LLGVLSVFFVSKRFDPSMTVEMLRDPSRIDFARIIEVSKDCAEGKNLMEKTAAFSYSL